jgi:hypothetical protein
MRAACAGIAGAPHFVEQCRASFDIKRREPDLGLGLQHPLPEIAHPRLRQLLAFWDAKRGARPMPGYAAIDAIELWAWLGNLILIEVTAVGGFRYRVYGTGLAEYYGRDLTGKTTDVLRPDVRALVCQEYAEVCQTARPLLVTHRRRVRDQPMVVEKLILPFAADDHTVARLLAGAYPSG